MHPQNQHCIRDFELLRKTLVAVIDYLAFLPVPPSLHLQYEELKSYRKDLDDELFAE